MGKGDPEIVVVGAGIAGSSLAIVLARMGLEVVLLERQREYRDRVRGEYMALWGVLEARALGLEDLLRSTGAVDARYSVSYDELIPPSTAEAAKRDTATFVPGVGGALCTSHPKACAALADEAARVGVEIVRGVSDLKLRRGARPELSFQNGVVRDVRPRLVVGAEGRTSTVRDQAGIEVARAQPTHQIAGLLVKDVEGWPSDQYTIDVEGDIQFYVFPQGPGTVRLYTCHSNEHANRWAGPDGQRRFLDAFAHLKSIPMAAALGSGMPAGPCATLSGESTSSEEPFADGVVLAGDAGGYDDPITGQGLSLALRDVRALAEMLSATRDWSSQTMRHYGNERAERLRRMRRVSTTYAALMTTFTEEGRKRRGRFYGRLRNGDKDVQMALAAMFVGPDRLPPDAFSDHLHESLLT